jgi:hypothetical protein
VHLGHVFGQMQGVQIGLRKPRENHAIAPSTIPKVIDTPWHICTCLGPNVMQQVPIFAVGRNSSNLDFIRPQSYKHIEAEWCAYDREANGKVEQIWLYLP